MPAAFQILAEASKVVNLAVEDGPDGVVLVMNRLVSG
jgi:hypothetical protein